VDLAEESIKLGCNGAVEFEAYKSIFDRVIDCLHTGSAGNEDSQLKFTVPTDSKGSNADTRAFAIHRALKILTFNLGLYTMLWRTYGRDLINDRRMVHSVRRPGHVLPDGEGCRIACLSS
jgi:hypothetical protein